VAQDDLGEPVAVQIAGPGGAAQLGLPVVGHGPTEEVCVRVLGGQGAELVAVEHERGADERLRAIGGEPGRQELAVTVPVEVAGEDHPPPDAVLQLAAADRQVRIVDVQPADAVAGEHASATIVATLAATLVSADGERGRKPPDALGGAGHLSPHLGLGRTDHLQGRGGRDGDGRGGGAVAVPAGRRGGHTRRLRGVGGVAVVPFGRVSAGGGEEGDHRSTPLST
jgi:hypothetical protein